MSLSHFDTNLSKIKPKFRTTGNISGNFGAPKRRAGSSLNEIGVTDKETIKVTKRSDYINRMVTLFYNTEDDKMRRFAYNELHRLHAI
tara:strand:- start:823 stop:1086 length:264 start_codon:yes stop_codon:yes gene_type:complete